MARGTNASSAPTADLLPGCLHTNPPLADFWLSVCHSPCLAGLSLNWSRQLVVEVEGPGGPGGCYTGGQQDLQHTDDGGSRTLGPALCRIHLVEEQSFMISLQGRMVREGGKDLYVGAPSPVVSLLGRPENVLSL